MFSLPRSPPPPIYIYLCLTNNGSFPSDSVTAVSVVRLYYLQQHLVDKDPDANFSLGFCVSAIECNLAIITASAPALWPLLRSWMPGVFNSLGPSYRKDNVDGEIEWSPGKGISGGGVTASMSGESFPLKHIKDVRGDNARGKTDIRASGMDDSDEEVLVHNGAGIMRTTDYSVARDDKGSLAASTRIRDPTSFWGGNRTVG